MVKEIVEWWVWGWRDEDKFFLGGGGYSDVMAGGVGGGKVEEFGSAVIECGLNERVGLVGGFGKMYEDNYCLGEDEI